MSRKLGMLFDELGAFLFRSSLFVQLVNGLKHILLDHTSSIKQLMPMRSHRVILFRYEYVIKWIEVFDILFCVEPSFADSLNLAKPVLNLLMSHLVQRTYVYE